ncbi:MAG: type II toxin-antitoxin system RelE/ParE family toxin [Syntrophales bacterium]|nr:type II toxin-antitoxin system RelE/ParE family toxin [Syntrophales bacterium]
MDILFTPLFRRFVKKQALPFQVVIRDEVDRICDNPEIGESKKSDLTGFRVHKFKFKKQEYLMAYEKKERSLIFYMVGTHENFYRDLKNYLSEV